MWMFCFIFVPFKNIVKMKFKRDVVCLETLFLSEDSRIFLIIYCFSEAFNCYI